MCIISRPKAAITTLHFAEVQFVFKQSHLHNSDYTISVRDRIDAEVDKICRELDVVIDGDYRCQWEGERLISTDIEKVKEAGKRLERVLTRFKYIEHIDQDAL